MYCLNCKEFMNDELDHCPKCNHKLVKLRNDPTANNTFYTISIKKPQLKYALIGFLFPWLGILLYLTIRDQDPNNGRMILKGGLGYVYLMLIFFALYLRTLF